MNYRRLLVSVGLIVPLVAVTLGVSPAVYAKQTKQLVCHINGYGETTPKMLPAKAASAHTSHGDPDPQTFYLDADGDGYQSDEPNSTFYGCLAPNYMYTTIVITDDLDCDDGDAAVNPEAVEIADNEIDDNCNGEIDETNPGGYEIGDEGPAGGIVFFVSADGSSGLEAAREDLVDVQWCSDDLDIAEIDTTPTGTTTDSHTGAQNTAHITAKCGFNTAAGVATNYEWPKGQMGGGFLPNTNEMLLMYENLYDPEAVSGPFTLDVKYWTSTESDEATPPDPDAPSDAWTFVFGELNTFVRSAKSNAEGHHARPIRAWTN